MFGSLFRPRSHGTTVAINLRPQRGPWGGGNQFVQQLSSCLLRLGYRVQYTLAGQVDAIVLIDPRPGTQKPFGPAEIAAYKRQHPRVRVLHRVNECDKRKGTDFMDRTLAEASPLADFTVFISAWLRDYHAERWFDRQRPHSAITNAADPTVFHPFGSRLPQAGELVRVVTHHWSNSPLKGFAEYAQVDRLIAAGALPGFELWVIGRWPDDLQWQSARTFPATQGHRLAGLLRQCHLYLTASRWEPCGMHHVEGAQCGLPMVFHEEGGGGVEILSRFGIPFAGDGVGAALQRARTELPQLREQVLANMPNGERMALEYASILQRLIVS